MDKRRLLTTSVGAIGAVAAANHLIGRRVEPLGPPLDREMGSYRWRGMEVAYTEAGDPENPDLVLFHGIHAAATSREFSEIFDQLARDHHVFAPDFPGFGRSDRPPLTYSAALYEAFVRDFIRDLTERPAVVATSLSSAYALDADAEVELSTLLLVCPTATTGGGGHRLTGGLIRLPLVGTAAFNLLTSRPAIRAAMRGYGVYSSDGLSKEDEAYYWQTAHQPGGRHAPASFVSGYLDSGLDIGSAIAGREHDTTLIWGREATTPGLSAGRELAERADAKLVVIDQAGALPHVEQPAAFLDVLADELHLVREE